MTGGETLVGAVLEPHAGRSAIGWVGCNRARHLSRAAHPLDLYAMACSVRQTSQSGWCSRIRASSRRPFSTPEPGTAVAGGSRRVSINDVMAAHGPRSGPVLSSLSRATIVVSRDQLLPPDEMAYWNFFSARLEDPTEAGISYDGSHRSKHTARRIDLRPTFAPGSIRALASRTTSIPRRSARPTAVNSSSHRRPVPGPICERFRVAGRVTARDRNDFNQSVRLCQHR